MEPTFIHAGVQKAGSTWIYHALKEHPDVFMPEKEPINYFDVNYHRGKKWYKKQFENYNGEKEVGDESPGYVKHPLAPKRAYSEVPNAKIIICLRNPIERAYSQWWSAESYWTEGRFERCTFHHATNDVFVTPGFYNHHISKWENNFGKENIKLFFFEDFKKDNKSFVKKIYEYIGVDKKFTPSIIGKKVQSGHQREGPSKRKNYQEGGMTKYAKIFLEKTYYNDIKKLEKKVNRDLSHWLEII